MGSSNKQRINAAYDTVIVSHVTELFGPTNALIEYCERVGRNPRTILHPLLSESLVAVTKRADRNTGLGFVSSLPTLTPRAILDYALQGLATLRAASKYNSKSATYVGVDCFNCALGILLRKFGRVKLVVFYVIDYTPNRFGNILINSTYHWLDSFCARRADCVWNISERIQQVWGEKGIQPHQSIVVPVGITRAHINRGREGYRESNTIVIASSLTRYKGIDLVLDSMNEILRLHPQVRLEIIGSGPYEPELREHASRLSLGDSVEFKGRMEHDKLLEYMSSKGIALSPYQDDPASYTYYADPTKIKEYLSCGLPVITTRVPWIAADIERIPMGIAIDYDRTQLIQAVHKLLTDNCFYLLCSRHALEYIQALSWDGIFEKAFCATEYTVEKAK